ncbi:hypothetical protein Tco_0604792 [Tanacetum coccineum]
MISPTTPHGEPSGVMSFLSAHTILETSTPTDRVRDSLVITPFHDDPYMIVRQAYTPISIDTKSEPLEDPIKTEVTQPLYPREAPLSLDYTPASPDYTPDTPHSNEDSEPIEAFKTRTASPSGSTSPLSPDHPLIQTCPNSTPSRSFYYCSTARMAVHTQPTLSPGISARVTEAMALSQSTFRKRYRSSYETPSSSATPASSLTLPIRKSEESEDEGLGWESEEAAPEGQQQQEVPVEDAAEDEPLGLGYGEARRRAIELAEDPVPNIEFDAPPVRAPVQTTTSPEWSSGSLPVSPASLTVPSPVASLVTTQAAIITIDEDEFIEVGAQLELHGSILHDHTQRLDALPPTLIEGMGQDITELYDRSAAVRREIHSQRFKLRSLEQGQVQATISYGALWQPVLALEAWT